jgi:hypothetical protein
LILLIHNRTPGLRDIRTKQPVGTDQPVTVADSPYWRQRIRQSHVDLVAEFASEADLQRHVAAANKRADALTKKPRAPKAPTTKPRGKRKRKPAPTLELDPQPETNKE